MIDRRLTQEDIDWLRKLRNAKAANQPSADIPTSVVLRLTQLACAEVGFVQVPRRVDRKRTPR